MADTDTSVPDVFDGIVIGSGHNGLVTAAYLARAGLSVLVLESRDQLGGGATTEELTQPLFLHNLHGYFVRWHGGHRIVTDLELERFGLELVHPPVQNAFFHEGGQRVLHTYSDPARTRDAIAAIDTDDARRFAELEQELRELNRRVLDPLRNLPPLASDQEREQLGDAPLGRRYLDLAHASALELTTTWFRSEPVRALVAFQAGILGYLPYLDQPDTGLGVVRAIAGVRDGRMVRGGSRGLADALARCLYAAGGRILTSNEVVEVERDDGGRATAVHVASGRRFRARRFVASCLPYPMTMDRTHPPGHDGDTPIDPSRPALPWSRFTNFGLHAALREVPDFRAGGSATAQALNMILGYDTLQDVLDDMQELRAGRHPRHPKAISSYPTVHDPSQAPDGFHTTFAWTSVPSLAEAPQPDAPDDATMRERLLALLERHAPGFGDLVVQTADHSPAATEQAVPSMRHADHHHGSYEPVAAAAQLAAWHGEEHYRAGVDGLYLCGSSQHPRGGITGGPGFIAAGVIADDLGVEPWWSLPAL